MRHLTTMACMNEWEEILKINRVAKTRICVPRGGLLSTGLGQDPKASCCERTPHCNPGFHKTLGIYVTVSVYLAI